MFSQEWRFEVSAFAIRRSVAALGLAGIHDLLQLWSGSKRVRRASDARACRRYGHQYDREGRSTRFGDRSALDLVSGGELGDQTIKQDDEDRPASSSSSYDRGCCAVSFLDFTPNGFAARRDGR